MKIKTKVDRPKTITIRVSQEEYDMTRDLRSQKIDYPQMLRDLLHKIYEEVK